MSNANYISTVLACLRDDYGVTDAQPDHGGKHPCVRFTHDGRRHRLTLGHDGRQRSVELKLRDIATLLGPPRSRTLIKPERRRLEDMMPTTVSNFEISDLNVVSSTTPKPATYVARVALYTKGQRLGASLRISITSAAVQGWTGLGVSRDGAETWELWNDPGSRKHWHRGDTDGFSQVALTGEVADGLEPFGLSPAEVVEVDGRLLVTCREAERVRVFARRPKVKPAERTSAVRPRRHVAEDTSVHARMVAVLHEIVAIEAVTDRRLARVKDEAGRRWWEWQAKPIRLE